MDRLGFVLFCHRVCLRTNHGTTSKMLQERTETRSQKPLLRETATLAQAPWHVMAGDAKEYGSDGVGG